ncbi:hypothetical protein [Methylocystis sp.]|uniref:hypothetical protein n=1 Tax=Methylocystis sp. TaxID=1911079 RepID=UPI0025FBE241|nr:hypothetical protein [Methylocystis sp.]
MTNGSGEDVVGKRAVVAADIPALDLTPIFSNRCNVTINQNITRFAFGEFVAGDQKTDVVYHTAVVMPTADAVVLADLLGRMITQLKELGSPTPSTQLPVQQPGSANAVADG